MSSQPVRSDSLMGAFGLSGWPGSVLWKCGLTIRDVVDGGDGVQGRAVFLKDPAGVPPDLEAGNYIS